MTKALVLERKDNQTLAAIQNISAEQLPKGNVTIDIDWSGINYKDALAITGKGKIIREFPMVPGIDLAGTVNQSDDPRFKIGQAVLLTGWGLGENRWGGLAEQARVNGDWLVPMPDGLDGRKAMAIGTAGFTAMLCVMALEDGGVMPASGDVVVTGASGGVGSTAVMLLSALGYPVTAISGRTENHDYLTSIGAQKIISRSEYQDSPRPMEKQQWAGAIDTVGGTMLAKVIAQMNYNGTIAACGLVGSYQLPSTVMPFILRNVRLQGVDSVMTPMPRRMLAWQRVSQLLPAAFYQQVIREIELAQVPQAARDLLDNKITGRTVVKIR